MEIDAKLSKDLTDLKKQLEAISGQKTDASPEQLFPLFFRVSLSTAEDGTVMSRSILFPSKSCVQASGLPASLLDVSSRSSTGDDGKRVFLLSDFICSTINSFAEPVSVVVALVANPSAPGSFSDLQITVFTWKPDGTAAPNVGFDWRCRLLSFQIIL
jgi:hypothetical protein